MILAALLLALVQAPTLAAVERLSPAAAGELALAGQAHGPVESVERVVMHMAPPGVHELEMLERPVKVADGCLRKRWTVAFLEQPGREAVMTGAQGVDQLSLAPSGACPTGRYVHLNPGLEPSQGFATLRDLQAFTAGRDATGFTCTDETTTGLCKDPSAVRREVGRLRPWAITRVDGDMAVWLGVPGEAVTEVRFKAAGDVAVSRRIPNPF